jgi:hypothetical protein
VVLVWAVNMQIHSANALKTHMGIVGACCNEQQGKDRPLHRCDEMLDKMRKSMAHKEGPCQTTEHPPVMVISLCLSATSVMSDLFWCQGSGTHSTHQ